MPSARSPDPSRCWPISAAIPIASHLANSRLTRLADGQVDFTWKDYRHHGKTKVMTLAADEFIRRFLLHAVPDGFHRIRHIGFLANGHRTAKLALCRALLAAPTPDPPTPESYRDRTRRLTGHALDVCPDCGGAMLERGPAAAPSTATCTILVRQLMTKTEARPTNQTSCDADICTGTVRRRADDGQIALCPVRPLRPTHHPQAITTAHQADCAFTATPKTRTSPLAFSTRNGASLSTPIASLPRGSVQSGFNKVAIRALGIVCVARPHRSLQIPESVVR